MIERGCIAVLGEALVDVVAQENGAAHTCPGGSGLNTAMALARLETPVAFCGALSRDEAGEGLAHRLSAEGVDLSYALRSPLPCPRCWRVRAPMALPSMRCACLRAPSMRRPARGRRRPARSISTRPPSPQPQARRARRRSPPCGRCAASPRRVSTRTSGAPPLPALDEARALIAARVAQADIVKVSAEDLAELGDRDGALLRDWRALGVKLILVTRGAGGATAYLDGAACAAPTPAVVVRDTIGAGDTFMAALLAEMHREQALGPHIGAFTAEQVARWLAFAAQAAALCCARVGCDPPGRAEIAANSVAPPA